MKYPKDIMARNMSAHDQQSQVPWDPLSVSRQPFKLQFKMF